jgi:hypothetical protein
MVGSPLIGDVVTFHLAFGADPELVSAYGRGYVQGAKESNVICAAKRICDKAMVLPEPH